MNGRLIGVGTTGEMFLFGMEHHSGFETAMRELGGGLNRFANSPSFDPLPNPERLS